MLMPHIGSGKYHQSGEQQVERKLGPVDQLIFLQSLDTILVLLPKIFPNYIANQTGDDRDN